MKEAKPDLKIAFVGPPVQMQPEVSLRACDAIDFVVRGEFTIRWLNMPKGRRSTNPQCSFLKDGRMVSNAERPQLQTEDLDKLPFASEVYKRNLTIENYSIPYLLHPYISFYSSRGCPALCTFCLWPQQCPATPGASARWITSWPNFTGAEALPANEGNFLR